jgi:hypothetical protein
VRRLFLYRGCERSNLPGLMNIEMQLRKTCNHPFLISGAEKKEVGDTQDPGERFEHLIRCRFVQLPRFPRVAVVLPAMTIARACMQPMARSSAVCAAMLCWLQRQARAPGQAAPQAPFGGPSGAHFLADGASTDVRACMWVGG